MGNPKMNNSSLDPLCKTIESLKQIKSALLPFVRLLKDDDIRNQRRSKHRAKSDPSSPNGNKDDKQYTSSLSPRRRAEAEAAVALAVGTLRYMGARLRGLDRGRKKGDPLRAELDKIRGMLVSLRKLESVSAGAGDGGKKGSVSENKAGGDKAKSQSKNSASDNTSRTTTKADQNNTERRKEDMAKKSGGKDEKRSKKKKQRR